MSRFRLQIEGIVLLIVMIGVAITIGYFIFKVPLEQFQEIRRIEKRMAIFAQYLENPQTTEIADLSAFVSEGVARTDFVRATQRDLVRESEAVGLHVVSWRIQSEKHLSENVFEVMYEVQLRGDLQHFEDYWLRLSTYKPSIFVENFRVSSGTEQEADVGLELSFSLSAYAVLQDLG